MLISNGPSSARLTVEAALKRYLAEISPTKRPTSAASEARHAKPLIQHLGKYSLAALSSEIIAQYRDDRLAGLDRKDARGQPDPRPRSPNTVRLDLALLGHMFNIAIKEWGIGLTHNPVQNIRRPAPGPGRDRRLTPEEQKRLLAAVDAHSNPMLGWIVRIALETGMRSSEITTLRRSQIDLDRRVVRLRETKNTTSRTVPLTNEATRLFRQALANPIRPIDTDLVFFGEPGKDGKRRAYQFNPVWTRIKKSTGILDFRFHDLRLSMAINTIATIYPWAVGGLTLFLVLYGYMLMMGRIQDAGSRGFIMTGKVLIISLLALNADIYLNWVVSGLQGVEEGLTSAFGGGGGGTVYETLDSSLSQGLELILQARKKPVKPAGGRSGQSSGGG